MLTVLSGLRPFERPADFSTDTMLLDSRALFLTIHHGFSLYLTGFVQKLLTNSGPTKTEKVKGYNSPQSGFRIAPRAEYIGELCEVCRNQDGVVLSRPGELNQYFECLKSPASGL